MIDANYAYYLESCTAKLQYLSDYLGSLTHVNPSYEIQEGDPLCRFTK